MPPTDSGPGAEPPPPARPPRKASLVDVARAVISSFLGIRKGKSMQQDAVSIKPHQVIVVAVALVAIFVVTLVILVRTIVSSAGGQL